MGENNFLGRFGEDGTIKRTPIERRPLTSEEVVEITKIEEESRQLLERQDAEPDRPPLTDEEEKESARKRLLVRQSLMNQNPEKK